MEKLSPNTTTSQALAETITKAGSKQTYYLIRYFANRELISDAYRAYGYFRWIDDILDAPNGTKQEKHAFINRQKSILESSYRGEVYDGACVEEQMLVDLIHNDKKENSGLRSYLDNMMGVLVFDDRRWNRLVTQADLAEYTRMLATSVTEAMFYFFGDEDPATHNENRYIAVTAAHITHLLRDTFEDNEAGYFNIPVETLEKHRITPHDVRSQAYQEWVYSRVQLARQYFRIGRDFLSQVKNRQCRLAGYTYVSRFEWILNTIERDHFILRPDYSGRKSLPASLWMGWSTLASMLKSSL